jgi:hypothetical protein
LATSNHTGNYNLSQYAAGDPVKFLTNYNQDMAAIDVAIKAASDNAAAKVPQTRTVAGLPLSADLALTQLTAAGLASGDSSGNANNALKLAGVVAASFPQISSGVFTPIIFGYGTPGTPTFTVSQNFWTKIGNQVFVQAQITLTSKGGMAGGVEIGGFPFAAKGSNAVGISFSSNLNLATGHILQFAELDQSSTTAIFAVGTGSGGINWLDASELTDTSILRIAGNYTAN